MINKVTFIKDNGESFDSWNDFSLVRTSTSIGKAEVKKYTIEVPGRDGELDYTEYFGEPKYKNRKITLSFECLVDYSHKAEMKSKIEDAINGQHVKVILEEDSLFYYVGRCTVDSFATNKSTAKVSIVIDAEPWKYKLLPTVNNYTITGTAELVVENMRKSVVPTIEVSSDMELIFGSTYELSAGKYYLPDFVLKKGENIITANGTGTIKMTYLEGGL